MVSRSARPHTAVAGDELVMLDPEAGRYFGLDPVGRRIWELLERPTTVSALCSALMTDFAVDAETCQGDVLRLLEQLAAAELLDERS